jgi:hypothetical protein
MEATIAWAYPELGWKPLPVFQAYSAYTHSLDRANADALSAADGPERILAAWFSIDNRNPGWESPAAMLAMTCRYEEIGVYGGWQVLGRVADRCGPERPLASVVAVVGKAVAVPDPGGPTGWSWPGSTASTRP